MNSQKSLTHTLEVNILNREFKFKCEESETEQLTRAADYLNDCVHTIKQSGKVIDYERMIVMAALNICNDALLNQQKHANYIDNLTKKMQNLITEIDACLESGLPGLQV